jgi:serine O-acetyltransferase
MNTFNLIQSDCFRITGNNTPLTILKQVLFGETFKYLFWMRICLYSNKNMVLKLCLFPMSKFLLSHYKFKYGICLSYRTTLGVGLYLPHFGGIVINDDSVLGDNLVISQGVTLGKTDRGERKGSPVINNNVFIGPNSVVVGGITIGTNALIAPNSYVNFDVPDNAVVSGNPAKIISLKGANEYIKRPWLTYE